MSAVACVHHTLPVLRSVGSAFDNIETVYGYCATCDEFVVVVDDAASRSTESRPMTPDERERLQTEDYRRTRLALREQIIQDATEAYAEDGRGCDVDRVIGEQLAKVQHA